MTVDPARARALKEQAARAVEKGRFAQAAQLYEEVTLHDFDPLWILRLGDCYRRAGRLQEALPHLELAAERYVAADQLLKAVSVCRMILEVAPDRLRTLELLGTLQSRRDASARPLSSVGRRLDWRVPEPATRAWEPEPEPAVEEAGGPGLAEEAVLVELETLEPEELAVGPPASESVPHPPASTVAELPRPPRRQPTPTPLLLRGAFDDLPAGDQLPGVEIPLDEEPAAMLRSALAEVPIFSSLSGPQLRRFTERIRRVEARAGEVLLRQGERSGDMFVVVSGAVDVTAASGGVVRPLGRIGEREFFGELAAVTSFRHSATVTAATDVELLAIDQQTVAELLADAPEVLRELLRLLRNRMVHRLVALSPLFAGMPEAEAEQLAHRFQFLELPGGQLLLERGQRAKALFVILCGGCDVHGLRDGEEVPVAVLGPGDIGGSLSLLDGSPEALSVRTRGEVWALALPRAAFHEVMLTMPQVLINVGGIADELRLRLARVGLR